MAGLSAVLVPDDGTALSVNCAVRTVATAGGTVVACRQQHVMDPSVFIVAVAGAVDEFCLLPLATRSPALVCGVCHGC